MPWSTGAPPGRNSAYGMLVASLSRRVSRWHGFLTFAREELDADGQVIYDRIREDRGAADVGLQFRALLHSPQAAGYLTSMGATLRFQSSMSDDLKELAIILVAREWDSGIEWTGHAVAAANAGVSDEAIEGIRTWQAPDCLEGQQAAVARFRAADDPGKGRVRRELRGGAGVPG